MPKANEVVAEAAVSVNPTAWHSAALEQGITDLFTPLNYTMDFRYYSDTQFICKFRADGRPARADRIEDNKVVEV